MMMIDYLTVVMGRYTENRTDIAVFNKTETDTDIGIGKTEKTILTFSVFHPVIKM